MIPNRRLLVLLALLAAAWANTAKADEAELHKQVAAAREKGIAFLKGKQKNGHWEDGFNVGAQNRGGVTALVVLALLESGLKPDDPCVQQGLEFLEKLQPEYTYTVSLQTLCFCKADAKKYAEPIKRNVAWLIKKARTDKDGLVGWSYPTEGPPMPAGLITDNSNSHFAVEALATAARTGTEIDAKLWPEIQAAYVRSQLPSGGWAYHPPASQSGAGERLTMTAAGVSCLAVSQSLLPTTAKVDQAALTKGVDRLGTNFRLVDRNRTPDQAGYDFYLLGVLRKAGTDTKRRTFPRGESQVDWYKAGAQWLLERQKAGGNWSGMSVDGIDIIATSYALRFLAPLNLAELK